MPQVTVEPEGDHNLYLIHLDNGESITTPEMNRLAKQHGATSRDSVNLRLYQRRGYRTQLFIQTFIDGQPAYTVTSGPTVTIGPIQDYDGPDDAFSPFWNLIRQDEPEPEDGGGVIIGGN